MDISLKGDLAKWSPPTDLRLYGQKVGALFFFCAGKDAEMEKTVLSVCREIFRAKNPGDRDREMWRVYLSDHRGRVGSLYSSREVRPGDVVNVDLQERDGRLLPCIVWA